jgi:hypothetical protein
MTDCSVLVDGRVKPGHDGDPDLPAIPSTVSQEISCRKSEIEIDWLHEWSCPFAFQLRWFRVSATPLRGGSERKNFPAKIPCNPLIRLVSHERIQGNPRNSNGRKAGFPNPKGDPPRKTKSGSSGPADSLVAGKKYKHI